MAPQHAELGGLDGADQSCHRTDGGRGAVGAGVLGQVVGLACCGLELSGQGFRLHQADLTLDDVAGPLLDALGQNALPRLVGIARHVCHRGPLERRAHQPRVERRRERLRRPDHADQRGVGPADLRHQGQQQPLQRRRLVRMTPVRCGEVRLHQHDVEREPLGQLDRVLEERRHGDEDVCVLVERVHPGGQVVGLRVGVCTRRGQVQQFGDRSEDVGSVRRWRQQQRHASVYSRLVTLEERLGTRDQWVTARRPVARVLSGRLLRPSGAQGVCLRGHAVRPAASPAGLCPIIDTSARCTNAPLARARRDGPTPIERVYSCRASTSDKNCSI